MLKVNSNVYYIVLQTKRALSLHMCKCVPVPEWSLHHTELLPDVSPVLCIISVLFSTAYHFQV